MNKQEHIKYWIETAEKDWTVSEHLYQSKDYVYSLFFAYLVLEKLSKAIWVKNNTDNFPPKIHNLVYLLDKSNIQMTDEQKEFLLIMNDFQIEGRYPDYQQKIFNICTKEKTDEILEKVKDIKLWLISKVQ